MSGKQFNQMNITSAIPCPFPVPNTDAETDNGSVLYPYHMQDCSQGAAKFDRFVNQDLPEHKVPVQHKKCACVAQSCWNAAKKEKKMKNGVPK